MALATTTLSVAVGVDDDKIVVASATSMAAGRMIRIDDEFMQVRQDYVAASTTVPVLRGRSSKTATHVITANVTHGLASDFTTPPTGVPSTVPSQRARRTVSITATGSLSLPAAGEDLDVVLNGTSVITLTIPVPTKDMDGCTLTILANGAAAHVLTFTGGLSGAGSSYDVFTMNGTKPTGVMVKAVNGAWVAPCQPGMAGTLTNIVGTLA